MKMTMTNFIRKNQKEIDEAIRRNYPGELQNDRTRGFWIMNDEDIYLWARKEGLRI